MPQTDQQMLARARSLRSQMTEPERRLWQVLRAKQLDGVKFTRQVVCGHAIPDFVARRCKLVIEVDGDTHAHSVNADAKRTAALTAKGYLVLRFTNADVMTNLEGVARTISAALAARPLSQPSPQRGEGSDQPPSSLLVLGQRVGRGAASQTNLRKSQP